MAEASKSTISEPAKTEGEMRRSKRVRQPSKRMLLYSQDTDSDSSLQKGKGKRPAIKIQKVDTFATTTKGTLEHHSTSDNEPVLAFVSTISDESEGEPLSEREDDLRTKRKGRKRGSKKVKGRCYDHDEQERIIEYRKEQERKSKEIIESLTDTERKQFLKEVCENQPSFIIDIARILSKRKEKKDQDPPMSSPEWCPCNRCPQYERVEDRVYCGMVPELCSSQRPEMAIGAG